MAEAGFQDLELESKEDEEEEEEEEEIITHPGVKKIHDIMMTTTLLSPIDISLKKCTTISLPALEWFYMAIMPKKIKFTNTGRTLLFSSNWFQDHPFIRGGPLVGEYKFSQLHFHWGSNNMVGSEHTVNGIHHVLEMHAVFYKIKYNNHETALQMKDGICAFIFFFQLQDETNPSMAPLTDAIPLIREPEKYIRLKNFPLDKLVKPFRKDYIIYSGNIKTSSRTHNVLWIVSREPLGISIPQLERFRTVLDVNFEPLIENHRNVLPNDKHEVFHVNPSGHGHTTLYILQKEIDLKVTNRPQQVNKFPRSSKEYLAPSIF